MIVATTATYLTWLNTAIIGAAIALASWAVKAYVDRSNKEAKDRAKEAEGRCEALTMAMQAKLEAELSRVDTLDSEQTKRIDRLEGNDHNIQQTYARLSGDLDRRILVYEERVQVCEKESAASYLHSIQAIQSAQQTERTVLAMVTGKPIPVSSRHVEEPHEPTRETEPVEDPPG